MQPHYLTMLRHKPHFPCRFLEDESVEGRTQNRVKKPSLKEQAVAMLGFMVL
jgi:hypothetical protein